MKQLPIANKTALNSKLKKMTLKNKAKLLDKVINYYGLHFEGYLWKEIHNLEVRG